LLVSQHRCGVDSADERSAVLQSRAPQLRRVVNKILAGSTGYQLTRIESASHPKPQPVAPKDRLVSSPVFVLSPVRSGSTLLRVILNSHSQICAPHELHLQVVRIQIEDRHKYAKVAMKQLGLSERKLEHLLWDRILHRTLVASGKKLIVDKTPQNVFDYERLTQAWPKARFIFLIRHPASIADSLARARKSSVDGAVATRVQEYVAAIEKARANLSGLTVRYEDLVSDPVSVTTEICRYLDLPWERSMIDYGSQDHGPLVAGVGDWSPAIRSGEIKASREIPSDDDIADSLRDACRAWGYLN
jgi:hypothetical protein